MERRFEYEPDLEGARDLREIKQRKINVGPEVRQRKINVGGAGSDPEVLELTLFFLKASLKAQS